jgi:hypothetical protein
MSTTAATPVESLAEAHSRMLIGTYDGQPQGKIAVQSGAEIAFINPPTNITGNVCGDSSFTGDPVVPGESGGDYRLQDLPSGAASEAYIGGCNASALIDLRTAAMAKTAKPMPSGAIGGLNFTAGTYSAASITVADDTNVTLKGGTEDIFLFQSGSYMVTGANTHFILKMANGDDPNENGTDGPQAKNILFVLTDYATTGAGSTLHGSILAGAAITHGARSDVSGYVLATAAMTVGEACRLNSANLEAITAGDIVTSPVETVITDAKCFSHDDSEGNPVFYTASCD